jgi:hypothetical protein
MLPSPEWKKKTRLQAADQVVPRRDGQFWCRSGLSAGDALQLAHVAGVLAERGRSFRPRLVKGLRDADGHVKWITPLEDKPASPASLMPTGTTVIRCHARHHALARLLRHRRRSPSRVPPTMPAARPAPRRYTPWRRTPSYNAKAAGDAARSRLVHRVCAGGGAEDRGGGAGGECGASARATPRRLRAR